MDLKNKLSEEEAKEILKLVLTINSYAAGRMTGSEVDTIDTINNFKKAGIIRKSAEEQAREYNLNDKDYKHRCIDGITYYRADRVEFLISLYDATLKEGAERSERKEG